MKTQEHFGTGYWGRLLKKHGHDVRMTKVHLVRVGGVPACGARIGKLMEYFWCAQRPVYSYLTCGHCQKIYKTL